MAGYEKTVTGGRAYRRTYTELNGVNLAADSGSIPRNELAYVENMYRDYASGSAAALESVPGFRRLFSLGGKPNGIYSIPEDGRTVIFCHVGTQLFRFYLDERDKLTQLLPIRTDLCDRRSVGFYFGGAFYLMDGEHYFRIVGARVTDATVDAYLPVTYLNGAPYEQRNLLRKATVERYIPSEPFAFGDTGDLLEYTLNADGTSCRVTGVRDPAATAITVKEIATVAGKEYPVTAIGDGAFEDCDAECIRLPEGITLIGRAAFRYCKRLTALYLPNSVERIEALAFFGCAALSDMYIGAAVNFIGAAAFVGTGITKIRYALGPDELEEINEEVVDATPSCLSELALSEGVLFMIAAEKPKETGGSYRFPIIGEAKSLISVKIDGCTVGSASAPVFAESGANRFSASEIYKALIAHPSVAMMSLAVARDGSFTVHGFSDFDDTVEITTLSGLTGYYRLTGVSPGTSGASLRVVRKAGSTETTYKDTGGGVTVGPLSASDTLTLYLDVTGGVAFLDVLFVPRLTASLGNASMCPVYENKSGRACVTAVDVSVSDDRCLSLRQLDIRLNMHDAADAGFIGNTGYGGDSKAAVTGSRCAAIYDGRIFFSGNPALPHTVLYTARRRDGAADPTYIGSESYFCDGSEKAPVSALVTSSGGLYVFKGDADDGSFVYRHEGQSIGDDLLSRIYPAVETVAGVMRVSTARNFSGLPVFLSERGLYGLRSGAVTGERAAFSLDRRVMSAMLPKTGEMMLATAWGYLLVSAGDGDVFLADGRSLDGNGYAFYRMTGIGVYHGDRPLYEYAHSLPEGCGFSLSPKAGERVTGEVLEENGFAYTCENGERYLVLSRGEREGGEFSPAVLFHEAEGLLLFLTERGDLACFYNDKRMADGRIPAQYYHFDRHRYRSAAVLCSDDCSLPHREKQAVRRSAVATLSRFYGGLSLYECRDRGGYELCDRLDGGGMDFAAVDFSRFHFANDREGIFPVRARGGSFKEIQYLLVSEGYLAHFGLNAFAFRYTVGGNVRK